MMVRVTSDTVPWEQLFEAAPIPLSLIDTHGRQITANVAYARLLGYEPDEIGLIDVGSITRPDEHQWTRTYLMRLVSGEIDEFDTHKTYVRKDGSEVTAWLRARALRDEFGECTMLIAALQPITHDGQSPPEAAMRRIQRLLEFAGDNLTLIGPDGGVIETTGRHTSVLGYPTSFWRDRLLQEVVAPHDRERLADLRERVLAAPGADVEAEIEVQAANGDTAVLHVRGVNCLDEPDINGIVVISRNVTEQRATVAELKRRRQTAEAVVDAQTRLLATVSHELRNPLHAVRGIAELLTGEQLPPQAAELAESLLRQVSALSHVTQDLLDAARLDAGKVIIEEEATDIGTLVADVVALGQAAVKSRDVHVSSRVARDVPAWALADGHRLRQVLGNLMGNAVKFTREGTVQLVVRREGADHLVFSVVDTGVGIPPEEQAAVLEPFTVGSTAGGERGAGLGLSIVQRLVAAMNGVVTMTSTVGEGTRFDVRLPLVAAEPPSASGDGALPAGLRVLVVEDNPVNQQLARSQLERLGLAAVIVETGEAGLDLLTSTDELDFDVVLMDQQLPGLSGTETTQRIRALAGAAARIPVIGLSASAGAADRDAFVAAGMTDFIAKPASLDDLATVIGHAVREHVDAAVSTEESAVPAAPDGTGDAAPADVGAESSAPTGRGGMVDHVVIDARADELGGDEIILELVRTFLHELAGRAQAISEGAAADETAARRAAHTLKSSARLLGAVPLADECARIERDGPAGHRIDELADATRTEFERWLASRT